MSPNINYNYDGEQWEQKMEQFMVPHSMAFDSEGNIYVTDVNNHRIQKFTSDGEFITKWGTEGNGDGEFSSPEGIDVDSHWKCICCRYRQ